MERTINRYNSQCVPKFSLQDTLKAFAVDNFTDYSSASCLQKVNEAGHGEILLKFHELFFQRKDPKKRLLWLFGPQNTGKSTFIGMIEEMFATQQFNFKQSYCTMDNPSRDKNWAVQIFTSHEFDIKSAFTSEHFANLKSLFEGKGGMVSANKHV